MYHFEGRIARRDGYYISRDVSRVACRDGYYISRDVSCAAMDAWTDMSPMGPGLRDSGGRGRGAAPVRGRTREASPEPQIDDREDQGGGATATPQDSQTREGAQTQEQQEAPVMQDAVGQPPKDPMVENDLAPAIGGQGAPLVVLTEDEQRRYEKF
uniref:Uncharacterized protein n=1 Tax=Solanum tuberosum TaxID=4113 RepID=M1B3V9_SOLTU